MKPLLLIIACSFMLGACQTGYDQMETDVLNKLESQKDEQTASVNGHVPFTPRPID